MQSNLANLKTVNQQPIRTAGRSLAEDLFESYLESQSLRWDYERGLGGRSGASPSRQGQA